MTTTTQMLARTEPNAKWIRGLLGNTTVVDSRDSLFVWEWPYYPQWYFPVDDVAASLLPNGLAEPTDNRGDATVYDMVIGDVIIESGARRFLDSPVEELRGRVRIDWNALDSWMEEDTEVIVHPRSPYSRIDALPSSRHVKVIIDGQVVADSTRPTILFETGLPARYYLPANDVRLDLLMPTETTTGCPYKGVARYWTATVNGVDYPDIVWSYPEPLPESRDCADLLCFYNEKVDIYVDGEPIGNPTTPFS